MKDKCNIIFLCLAILCVSLIALISCTSKTEKTVDEGIIEFDARVVDYNHPLADLAPGSATLKFKENKIGMEMTAMGMFKNTYVCDLGNKTLTQMINFLDLKQATVEREEDIKKENEGYKLIIEETAETKMIAGYKCRKVIVKKAENPSVTFEAYYTPEMGTENINSLSPYSQINGMLMQYRLSKMGLEMEFTARSVKKESIPDEAFIIPKNFKKVSKEEMQKFFAQF